MADPRSYLPSEITESAIHDFLGSLQLPPPSKVKKLDTAAEYHKIYIITFAPDCASQLLPAAPNEPDGSVSLVLRVAGKHLPQIKTANEVAAMAWVRDNTKIPIPAVVKFDDTAENVLGNEFMLAEKVPGVSVDSVYDKLDESQKELLVDQLIEYLIELHQHEWHHVGGLSLDEHSKIVPGRILAENFWQAPEIPRVWGPEESVDTVNPRGPFENYTAYIIEHIKLYIRNIRKHPSLDWMHDLIPRLEEFIDSIQEHEKILNDTRYIFTQKDLHFGNIMCDPVTARITGILDWEFAAVLPVPLWNPGGGFLWNAQYGAAAFQEKERMVKVFENKCAKVAPNLLADYGTEPPHDTIKTILNFTRGIIEVCPRGQKAEEARKWRKTLESALDAFKSSLGQTLR